MALLFSYGSLQEEKVQLATFGRLLGGEKDELVGYQPATVAIDDPAVAAEVGRTHHADVQRTGDPRTRVAGMVFELTDAELEASDLYEARFRYLRHAAPLASGRRAWVYAHAG